jgi:hypothetical protein
MDLQEYDSQFFHTVSMMFIVFFGLLKFEIGLKNSKAQRSIDPSSNGITSSIETVSVMSTLFADIPRSRSKNMFEVHKNRHNHQWQQDKGCVLCHTLGKTCIAIVIRCGSGTVYGVARHRARTNVAHPIEITEVRCFSKQIRLIIVNGRLHVIRADSLTNEE